MKNENGFLPKLEKKSKFLVTALIISALGHIPLMVPEPVKRGRQLTEDASDLVEVAARNISRYKFRDSKGEAELKNKLAKDLADGKDIDFADAIFSSERMGQGMTPEEDKLAREKFKAMLQDLEIEKPEVPDQIFLKKVVAYSGGSKAWHKTKSSVVGFLADGGDTEKGNCEARAKLMVMTMEKLYPQRKHEIGLQHFEGHVRTIFTVKENETTYALEGDVPIVKSEDRLATAIETPRDFLKRYVGGEKAMVKVTGPEIKNSGIHEGGFTDSIFAPPKTEAPLRQYSAENPFVVNRDRISTTSLDEKPIEIELIRDWTPEQAKVIREKSENNADSESGELPFSIDASTQYNLSVETVKQLNAWKGKQPLDQIWYGDVGSFSEDALREALKSPAENLTISVGTRVPEVLRQSVKPQTTERGIKPAREKLLTISSIRNQKDERTLDQIIELAVMASGIPEMDIFEFTQNINLEQAQALAASEHKILHLNCKNCDIQVLRSLAHGKPEIKTRFYYEILRRHPEMILEPKFKPSEDAENLEYSMGAMNTLAAAIGPSSEYNNEIKEAILKEAKRLSKIQDKINQDLHRDSEKMASKILMDALQNGNQDISLEAQELSHPTVNAVRKLTDWPEDRRALVKIDVSTWSPEALGELFKSQATSIHLFVDSDGMKTLNKLGADVPGTRAQPIFTGEVVIKPAKIGKPPRFADLMIFLGKTQAFDRVTMVDNLEDMSPEQINEFKSGIRKEINLWSDNSHGLSTLRALNQTGFKIKFLKYDWVLEEKPEILEMENLQPSESWATTHRQILSRIKQMEDVCEKDAESCGYSKLLRLKLYMPILKHKAENESQSKRQQSPGSEGFKAQQD